MPILSSWREIAAHLGKGVRTVQRWERELGLPVHRPIASRGHVVFAYTEELDRWIRQEDVLATHLQPRRFT
jgi:hypothetical protein